MFFFLIRFVWKRCLPSLNSISLYVVFQCQVLVVNEKHYTGYCFIDSFQIGVPNEIIEKNLCFFFIYISVYEGHSRVKNDTYIVKICSKEEVNPRDATKMLYCDRKNSELPATVQFFVKNVRNFCRQIRL